jgi:hypothetical protein
MAARCALQQEFMALNLVFADGARLGKREVETNCSRMRNSKRSRPMAKPPFGPAGFFEMPAAYSSKALALESSALASCLGSFDSRLNSSFRPCRNSTAPAHD